MPRNDMPAFVVDSREPTETQIYLVNLNTAANDVWRNLQDNIARGKRTYEGLSCETTDGLLTEDEEEDDTAISEVLDWITDMCTPDNIWNPAEDGRLQMSNVVKIIIPQE